MPLVEDYNLNMEKYLRYLKSDIEEAIAQAGFSFVETEVVSFDNGDTEDQQIPMRISTITGFEAEVFPPAHRLNRIQLSSLFSSIRRLLEAHRIHWHIPPGISLRNKYEAARKAFAKAVILYDRHFGGELDLCELLSDSECPYQDNQSYCSCQKYKSDFLDSFHDFEDEPSNDINSYLSTEEYNDPDEPWINPSDDSASMDKGNASETEESPEELFLRYFFDTQLDNMGDEWNEDDPRINWSDEDDNEIPF